MKKTGLVFVVLFLAGFAQALILPDSWDGEKWIFTNQMCDPWIPNLSNAKDPDPEPDFSAFDFLMTTEDFTFEAIALPPGFGFDNIALTIIDGTETTGTIITGTPQDMSGWYMFTPGVRWFRISGFNLSFDPSDPEDQDIFPWWLRFSPCPATSGVTYSVSPVLPEPATICLFAMGTLGLLKKRGK